MLRLKEIYYLFFVLGLFFFPFNSFTGLAFLGEYKNESGAYFFLIGFFFVLLEIVITFKIYLPKNNLIFKIILLLLIWFIFTTLLNLDTVLTNYFKHTNGLKRFFRQFISILFPSIFFTFLFWRVLKDMGVNKILYFVRKIFLCGLIFASIYGFLEITVLIFNFSFLNPIYKLFNYFPFLEQKILSNGRISSVSFEPPFLAIYLISIAGWMFSYIITAKSFLKYIPTALILILTYYSGSRTALIIIILQLIIFLKIVLNRKQKVTFLIATAMVVFFISSVTIYNASSNASKDINKKIESLNFVANLKKSVSNQTRFGIQVASLKVFVDNPIIGVGFGQQSFHARYLYPSWALKDNWEFKYIYQNTAITSFPPGYNLYTRLLAETGIIGLGIFVLLIYTTIIKTKRIIKNHDANVKTVGIILLITFVGLFINWFQVDTFRVYIVWFSFCVLMRLENILDNKKQIDVV